MLNTEQIAAFYYDGFVRQQVEHFRNLALPILKEGKVVVDIGGGCGYFARAIKNEFNLPVRVIDTDTISIEMAKSFDIDAIVGDALQPQKTHDVGLVCFNLILHHLVSNTEEETLRLQVRAISSWKESDVNIFVSEYVYDSWFGDLSGWLIYQITRSMLLSTLGKWVSKAMPSLKANTFGVGVRFRSRKEWKEVFERSGFSVKKEIKGNKEFISFPRRLLLIREVRRDSFLLAPR